MKFLTKLLWLFIYALPTVLFFSYHPVISFGSDASMNFELSLPLIWLVLFDLGAFVLILILGWHHRRSVIISNSSKSRRGTSAKLATSRPTARGARSSSKTTSPGSASQSVSLSPWGYNFFGISDRRFFLLALFPLYLTISVFWSPNPLRGLLTAGIVWLLFFAIFAMLFILPQVSTPRRLRTHVLLVFFVSSVLVCKFCYAQSIMDTLGLSRDTTLLCAGCTYRSFGFPHPSGFAIEPQFMGNLLLAPTLTALYLVVFRSRKFTKSMLGEADYLESTAERKLFHGKVHLPRIDWSRWRDIGMTILAGFLSMTLFFTFSRGAIYAYAVALLVLFIFALKRHQFRWSLITIPVVSFLLSLGLQGTFAAVGPTAETFVSGVTKSIHQLSLGLIDLRPQSSPEQESCGNPVENSGESVENSQTNCAKPVDKLDSDVEKAATIVDKALEHHEDKSLASAERTAEDVVFEGYVPESTNIRLQLNQAAFDTWLSAPGHPESSFTIGLKCFHSDPCLATGHLTPTSIFFGVGLGGAGTALYRNEFITGIHSPKEIVQHQGFSLLLETGLVGVGLAIFGLLVALFPRLFSRKFLDGRASPDVSAPFALTVTSVSSNAFAVEPLALTSGESDLRPVNVFWQHPALPLLAALIVAYLITLNFFSGLPNALQIYLMPPLLYLIFSSRPTPHPESEPAVKA